MSTATTFPAYVKALKANLDTRFATVSGLTDVAVFTAPVSVEQAVPDRTVVFAGTSSSDVDPEAMPVTMSDRYLVDGAIVVAKAGKTNLDGTETVAEGIRDDAGSILDVVATELNADRSQSSTVINSYLAEAHFTQGVEPATKKRVCVVEFRIAVRART